MEELSEEEGRKKEDETSEGAKATERGDGRRPKSEPAFVLGKYPKIQPPERKRGVAEGPGAKRPEREV